MKYKVAMCFCTADPLHFGHIRLFKRASRIAERVYACTKSDEIIREEWNREPFTTEKERVEDLRGIKYLTDVFIKTKEKDRQYFVDKVGTDVLILGSDWKGRYWEGEKLGSSGKRVPTAREGTVSGCCEFVLCGLLEFVALKVFYPPEV